MKNAVPKTTRPAKNVKEAIKFPILAPLFAAILVLLVTFTLAIYRLQQQHLTDDVRVLLDGIRHSLNLLLAADARLLSATTCSIKDDPNIQSAWLASDHDKLLSYTAPLLEKFRRDYRVTHLYFIDVNNTCFLRVHNPTRFGDRIDRFTLNSAAKTGEPAWGIELGPYGTFTLRMVHPWFVNGSLTGFIELGEEINHIAPQLKETLNVDLVFLINKSFLTRQSWEEGLKMMGRNGNWDLMPNDVIADSTIAPIPPELVERANMPHSQHGNSIVTTTLDGITYRGGFVQLKDAAGHEVGDILVIKNVSKDQASLHALLAVAATFCFLVAALLVSFFYIHITRIEKHLIDGRSSLEKEVAQRTEAEKSLAKANDDLQFAVAQLSRSNRQLSEFAHLATHDLKTPLRGISILAEWLVEDYYDKFDEQGQKRIGLLVSRVRRMDNLINAVLQYTTIVRNEHNEHQADLNALLRAVIAEIQPPPNITITVNQNLPVLTCDEEQIGQVFHNLVANAVKFTDKPDGLITIDFEDEKYFWKFSVADNGPGIEPQHFERIFQLFQTLSDREDAENAGIGLTIAKKIVELYDGKIWLTSKLGAGSTFFFTLPKSSTGDRGSAAVAINSGAEK